MPVANIALVGNPNCGKTTLFNALTGARQEVGNWPGVTVEKKSGRYAYRGSEFEVVDLPGVYSLAPSSASSEDERVARDYILSAAPAPALVLNIVDASNLERNLYLTAQLVDMNVPLVMAVNMVDIAKSRQLEIDVAELSRRLGCPVVAIVASRGRGLDALRGEIASAIGGKRPTAAIAYPPEVERVRAELVPLVLQAGLAGAGDAPWVALQLLEGDAAAVPGALAEAVGRAAAEIEERLGEEPDIIIADARYRFIGEVAGQVMIRKGTASRTLSDRIDDLVLHRALGVPIFLAVMYAMFVFTIQIGGSFIDLFDGLFGILLVDGLGAWLRQLGAPEWAITFIADGLGGGLQTVSTFVPIVGFLFLFLSVLEDSGYMARGAFVMDRFMRGFGLPGKAFVPLIVGFGCNVPAVMATRTLENKRDRIITVMMAPFMSCGARLPVYALFAAAFFPANGQNLVFALYLAGIAVAVLTGLVLRSTLLRGETSTFVMEMPPYHLPTLRGVLLRTWERLKGFVWRAGKVIVAIVMVLNVLNSLGTDGSFGNQHSDRSVLAAIGKAVTPVFAPLGISADNWPATVAIFSGIFAKEAVVGTLNALYSASDGKEAKAVDVGQGIVDAFATVPANLGEALAGIASPLGFSIGEVNEQGAVAGKETVAAATLATMRAAFDGTAGAFAFLMTVLLYMPCVAATAAIWRETGTRWTLFAAGWTTTWGYGAGVIAYQVGTFAAHPAASAGWIALVAGVLGGAVAVMRHLGQPVSAAGHRPLPVG